MKFGTLPMVLALPLLASACGAEATPPPVAPAADTTVPAAAVQPSKPEADAKTAQIAISDEIKRAGGLTEDQAYFSFDSAVVQSNDRDVLAKVARCFATGALSGRRMKVVGHADPRGDSEYNVALAGDRADNVKKYISVRGLSGQRIDTSSRGAFDATGHDEATWARDRRVDVAVAN
jgi:peptidoglycan-associated lipoprotein